MEVFELILMLLLAVLLSSILDQVVPRISSPLIQIALGIGIAMLAISPIEVNIDPELFLVLFIAPLLFSDALEADKRNLWENKTTIVSFAIGLVIVITLCVGFVLHWLVPSIPLAAAFALGAAPNWVNVKELFSRVRLLLMTHRVLFHFSLRLPQLLLVHFLLPTQRLRSLLDSLGA